MTNSPPKSTFNRVAQPPARTQKRKRRKPFSLGLYDEERAQIERDAGSLPLGVFIRGKLLGDNGAAGRKRNPRRVKRPSMDHKALAQLLGTLGQSELGRSMIALSLAAQCGALPVDEELRGKLDQACTDIAEMRRVLIVALGLKPQGGAER